MREIRLRYGADVLLGTEFVQQLNRIEDFELLNTLGRSDAVSYTHLTLPTS